MISDNEKRNIKRELANRIKTEQHRQDDTSGYSPYKSWSTWTVPDK